MKLERIGKDETFDKELFVLEADSFSDIPDCIQLPSKYHLSLVACDCLKSSDEEIAGVIKKLLTNGCRYIHGWGPGSTRIDIIADIEIIRIGKYESDEEFIGTSWEDNEPIEEAIWFILRCAFPSDTFWDECKTILAVCINDSASAERIRRAFAHPDRFINDFVSKGSDTGT